MRRAGRIAPGVGRHQSVTRQTALVTNLALARMIDRLPVIFEGRGREGRLRRHMRRRLESGSAVPRRPAHQGYDSTPASAVTVAIGMAARSRNAPSSWDQCSPRSLRTRLVLSFDRGADRTRMAPMGAAIHDVRRSSGTKARRTFRERRGRQRRERADQMEPYEKGHAGDQLRRLHLEGEQIRRGMTPWEDARKRIAIARPEITSTATSVPTTTSGPSARHDVRWRQTSHHHDGKRTKREAPARGQSLPATAINGLAVPGNTFSGNAKAEVPANTIAIASRQIAPTPATSSTVAGTRVAAVQPASGCSGR
jgi:hypothetical protein